MPDIEQEEEHTQQLKQVLLQIQPRLSALELKFNEKTETRAVVSLQRHKSCRNIL